VRQLHMVRDGIIASWWGVILAEHDTEPAELSGGALKCAIGLWLLLPFDTFASSPTFVTLAILPEWVWGTALLCVGVFHLGVLRLGDRSWRQRASLFGFLVWFSFAVVFVFTNPPAFGWLAFMMAGLAQMWCSIRLGRRG
jgi:hypothetical protein